MAGKMGTIVSIEEMESGPELDVLVAEKVFGWQWNIRNGVCYAEHDCFNAADCWPQFRPSTDIADAWTVVQKFKDYDWKIESHGDGETFTIYKDGTHYCGDAPTAPLAICRAALKAIK